MCMARATSEPNGTFVFDLYHVWRWRKEKAREAARTKKGNGRNKEGNGRNNPAGVAVEKEVMRMMQAQVHAA